MAINQGGQFCPVGEVAPDDGPQAFWEMAGTDQQQGGQSLPWSAVEDTTGGEDFYRQFLKAIVVPGNLMCLRREMEDSGSCRDAAMSPRWG